MHIDSPTHQFEFHWTRSILPRMQLCAGTILLSLSQYIACQSHRHTTDMKSGQRTCRLQERTSSSVLFTFHLTMYCRLVVSRSFCDWCRFDCVLFDSLIEHTWMSRGVLRSNQIRSHNKARVLCVSARHRDDTLTMRVIMKKIGNMKIVSQRMKYAGKKKQNHEAALCCDPSNTQSCTVWAKRALQTRLRPGRNWSIHSLRLLYNSTEAMIRKVRGPTPLK